MTMFNYDSESTQPTSEDLAAYRAVYTGPNYNPQFPGRKLEVGICCYWIGRARVYVEEIDTTWGLAYVRPDSGDGVRGRRMKADIIDLDPEREWKFV